MNVISPITPVSGSAGSIPLPFLGSAQANGAGFASLLENGLADVEARVAKADRLVEAYARGDTIPVHQVTLALEQARVAVEIATQVRSRLVEVYRDFMSMQL